MPGGVKALGMVSLLMDTSSELIHSLLPVFMASTLGASMLAIGIVEGIAEATASASRVISGLASDRIRRRKTLVVAGYGLATLSKPLVPLASSIAWVAAARFIDRVGKGIRGAPRDALIADLTPPDARGAAYGLRQGMDSLGAVLGPLVAILSMAALQDDLRTVLWIGVIPALLAVGWLVVGVREPTRPHPVARERMLAAGLRSLGRPFWTVTLLWVTISLARFSEAFLVLRAGSVGLSMGYAPLVMIVMNIAYALAAYPGGRAADRRSRRTLLLAGMSALASADLVLALATDTATVLVGALLWGLHLAFTQGLLAKLLADAAPRELRGTAFGISSLANAAALLVASLLAGVLWDRIGPAATFGAGGLIALAATIGVLRLERIPTTR